MFFILAVSLYTSRVVLRTLGVSDYGVFNVVAGFVSMFGFLNVTLASSLQRFYNYERQPVGDQSSGRGEKKTDLVSASVAHYRRVYAAGMTIQLSLAFLLLVLMETVGWWYVNHVMVVPAERLLAANVAYQMALFSLLFVVLEIPYTAAIMAREYFDYYAMVGIAEVVLRLVAVIALPWLPWDKVMALATMTLAITVVRFLLYFIYAKRKILKANFLSCMKGGAGAETDKAAGVGGTPLLRRMLSFSGWNLLGTFAMLMKGQGVNMLLNVFFGTVVNAARAVAFQVNAALTGFSNNVAMSFQPQIVGSYANGDRDRVMRLFHAESRICFVLMAVLITPLVLEMDYVLGLWLGDAVPPQAQVFTALVLIDSLLCMFEMPCTQVAYAVGRIRDYKVVPSIVGLLLLPSAWVALHLGVPAVTVFELTIVFTVLQLTASLLMLHRIFNYSFAGYTLRVLLPCVLFAVLNVACPLLVRQSMDSSWLRLLGVCAVDVVLGVVLAYALVLDASEKQMLKGYCQKLLRR